MAVRFFGSWRFLWAASLSCVAALAGAYYFSHVRPRQQPLPETLEKIAALAPELQRKLCAHRANNIPIYRAAKEHFDCVEIDVVINPPIGDAIAVYHPPTENHLGLSLAFLLRYESLPKDKLWLDVKDLSDSNWRGFLSQLNDLVPMERRGDIVVETSWENEDVRDAALAIRGHGYMFSYYLPTEPAIECDTTTSEICGELRMQVVRTASYGYSHISFDARAFPFVQSIRDKLPSSIRLLTWDITPAWPRTELIREVEIYIVRFPNHFST